MYGSVVTETPREALARLALERGTSLSALSRMVGRNVAYLGQYVGRGTPRVLPEHERGLLADFLGVDPEVLGAMPRTDDVAAIPYLAVEAAAGAGVTVTGERVVRYERLARATLRASGVAPDTASLIRVMGDSMTPGLCDGDRVVVDGADRRVPAGGAVFVIRIGDALAVKRLVPGADGWEVRSDNPDYAARSYPHDALVVIGRARLLLRDLN